MSRFSGASRYLHFKALQTIGAHISMMSSNSFETPVSARMSDVNPVFFAHPRKQDKIIARRIIGKIDRGLKMLPMWCRYNTMKGITVQYLIDDYCTFTFEINHGHILFDSNYPISTPRSVKLKAVSKIILEEKQNRIENKEQYVR